ncbi:EAL domain protein [Maioricimonas rarisocia]|uniref:EAL domain protein n=1 Tax=Maioricimonas rarisocia TaxID=2528026 RepID=A0A517ZD43_9PLAN|nr:HDOD domain-containing protein [Maioricimonas rarisocia]QDU40382.1 EAL domain protein [Maioricimonas rarisocia]
MPATAQPLRDAQSNQALIGRQPIFDAHKQVVAYELLFRSSQKNAATVLDEDQATGDVLVNAFVEIGLEGLVGNKLAFINLTRRFIENEELIPDAPGQLVLEILETIVPDAALIQRVASLAERGFTIALDDWEEGSNLAPLLPMADIVKVELPAIAPEDLPRHVAELKKHNVRLLAEKLETSEEFEQCSRLGFDYFQGYFLSRPEIVAGKKIQPSQFAALKILSAASHPNVTLKELEEIVSSDPALSYKFLRFINSIHLGLRYKVSSIKQAISMLGINGVRRIVSLLTVAGMCQDKPTELMRMALIRGQMAMALAEKLKHEEAAAFFTAGLISLMDAILDTPLSEVLKKLPLERWVIDGIENGTGILGTVLASVKAYEEGKLDQIGIPGLDASDINDAYWAAVRTADELDSIAAP